MHARGILGTQSDRFAGNGAKEEDMSRMYSSRRLEMIRARSYELWEHEGRQDGKAEEYWLRAEIEIEAECRAAIEGKDTTVVLPLPRISRRPIRRASAEIDGETHSEAA